MKEISNLDWSDAGQRESLTMVYEHIVEMVEGNIDWYNENIKGKKQWASRIRLLSLGALGFGTVIPVIVDAVSPFLSLPASLATLVLAFGSGLIVFDRYMGYSTAWMRFRQTEMLIGAKLEAFQYQWMSDNATWGNQVLEEDELALILNRMFEFRAEINKIVRDETQLWIEEFKTSIKMLDENFQQIIEATRNGTITVEIQDCENYEGGWILSIDNKEVERGNGRSAAIMDVKPGSHKVSIEGLDDEGNIIEKNEKPITVNPGTDHKLVFIAKNSN